MKKKLSALISSILMLSNTSCSTSSNTQNGEKKSLIERLKTLCSEITPPEPPIESAMCYDVAAPLEEMGPCMECGKETEDYPYFKNNIDEKIPTLARYGYDATTSCICDTCMKKMLQEKRIISDLEEGETVLQGTSYVVLNIKKQGEETFRQILITKEETISLFLSYNKKQKNNEGEDKHIAEDEKAAYLLLTGESL